MSSGRVFPIWVATWEIECCQPEATVGERWEAPLILHPGLPWWVRDFGAQTDPSLYAAPMVELEVEISKPAPTDQDAALGSANGLAIAVYGARQLGRARFKGLLWFDAHGGLESPSSDLSADQVWHNGTVRRVRRVPLIYAHTGGRSSSPVGQREAIEINSTQDRLSVPAPKPDARVGEQYDSDILIVDLEIDSEQK